MREKREAWSRRAFLGALAAAGVTGMLATDASAEPPPETATLKLAQFGSLCISPQYVAEELLRGEGFTDLQYFQTTAVGLYQDLTAGRVHLSMGFVAPAVLEIDAGAPLVMLAGVHPGCYVVFGTEQIRSIKDFKGKTIAIPAKGSGQQIFLSTQLAYVGLDPRKDVTWVTHPPAEGIRLLAEGKVDGYLGFPPEPQELRARKIGRVVVDTAVDRPWSQYFCCLLISNHEFVKKHPVATKRAIRAILKAADVCALDPNRAARSLVDKGYEKRPDYALQVMKDVPYGKWRQYEPEDTVRFYALRLHEAGLIKGSPQKIIAQGTDWRFIRELKQELKG
jgi:NitT/TauT family transport system substrate-binding protein